MIQVVALALRDEDPFKQLLNIGQLKPVGQKAIGRSLLSSLPCHRSICLASPNLQTGLSNNLVKGALLFASTGSVP